MGWSPFYVGCGLVAVLPSAALVPYRRHFIDGGFVLEINGVVGPWRQSKIKADCDGLWAYRCAMGLPDPWVTVPSAPTTGGRGRG